MASTIATDLARTYKPEKHRQNPSKTQCKKNNNHLPWKMPSIRDENWIIREFLLQSSSFSTGFFPWASGLGLGGSKTSVVPHGRSGSSDGVLVTVGMMETPFPTEMTFPFLNGKSKKKNSHHQAVNIDWWCSSHHQAVNIEKNDVITAVKKEI